MSIEINLIRNTNENSWGFCLTGGAEYNFPLMITRVHENSIAENAGLKINDIIERINSTPTAPLTHAEAHDLLLAAGNDLILAIKRGNKENIINDYFLYNEENENNLQVLNILHDYEIVNEKNQKNVAGLIKHTNNKIIENNENNNTNELFKIKPKNYEKQWSTFLQKLDKDPPISKQKEYHPPISTYKVEIKKQKRKVNVPYIIKDKKSTEETIITTNENQQDIPIDENECEIENNSSDNELTNLKEEENFDEDSLNETQYQIEKDQTVDKEIEQVDDEIKEIKEEEETTDSLIKETLNIQLAQIQEQLLALSRLPSTLQDTLNSITKELEKIVPSKIDNDAEINNDQTDENVEEKNENFFDESQSSDNESENVNHENEEDEECLEKIEEEDEVEEEIVDNKIEEIEEKSLCEAEEESEEERIQKELREKQEKEEMQQLEQLEEQQTKIPLKPLERPIILPGGRRWSNEEDASKAVRRPKMSDEKIANTIETFSEVISGKLKGINFLKYQPPPKNLDYLRNSDVYKMIHHLEPETKGICGRASKILAEEDYYKEVTN